MQISILRARFDIKIYGFAPMALGGIGIKMGAIRRMGGLISMTRGITLIPLAGCRPVHRRHFVSIRVIWRNGYGLV